MPTKKKLRDSKLTIIFIRDETGKPHPVVIRFWLFIILGIASVVFILISMFSMYGYIITTYQKKEWASEKERLLDRLHTVETDLEAIKKRKSPQKVESLGKDIKVKDFKIYLYKHNSYRFSFSLNNLSPGNRTVSGYVSLILSGGGTQAPYYIAFPQMEVEKGLPKDYRKGQSFSIQRLKIVSGTIERVPPGVIFNNATIIAYSNDGRILHKKTHEIK